MLSWTSIRGEREIDVAGDRGVVVVGEPLLPARSATAAEEGERGDREFVSVGEHVGEEISAERNGLCAGVENNLAQPLQSSLKPYARSFL